MISQKRKEKNIYGLVKLGALCHFKRLICNVTLINFHSERKKE